MTQYNPHARVAALLLGVFALSAPAAAGEAPAESFPGMTAMADEEGLPPVHSLADARAAAPDVSLRADAPLRYVVKKGDTLWTVASRFLADPWQWPELWYVNGKIANPHLIYPGDVLELAYLNGRPVLAKGGGGLERVRPQVRELAVDAALPAIPMDAIRNFLRGPRLVDAETLAKAPYLLSFTDDHILGGVDMGIYLRNLPEGQGTNWALVRRGDTYRDPDTQEVLGIEAIPSGECEVRHYGEPAEALITKSFREVLRGDYLLPLEAENFQASFYPHAPAQPIGGKIISVFDGVSQIGQYQIVTLNRGSNHGVESGHVLAMAQSGRTAVDPYTRKTVLLPRQEAGLVMVFKTTPKLSYALVMTATRAAHVLDSVEKPGYRAPPAALAPGR